MASLKDQLDKATTDLNRAGYVRDQSSRSLRNDTRYGKFENRPQSEKDEINKKLLLFLKNIIKQKILR
jgi:hypothetical protein